VIALDRLISFGECT